MRYGVNQMKKHLRDMKELITDVAKDHYLPHRFRKVPIEDWRKVHKFQFLEEMREEVKKLEQKIENFGKPRKTFGTKTKETALGRDLISAAKGISKE